jgi:hypothetical protein
MRNIFPTMSSFNYLNALSPDEARGAYRVGVARALSELGLTPSEAEWALTKAARLPTPSPESSKVAASIFPSWVEAPLALGQAAGTIALVGGGALGAATGHLRHSLENRVEDQGDPQTEELRRKIIGYRKMKRELETARAAGLSQ